MLSLFARVLQFGLLAFTSIFFLVDPFAAIPTFLVITAGGGASERKRTAKTAAFTCCVVLLGFAFAGTLILRLFGITLVAFKIAGGVILMLIGLDMLRARRSPTKETLDETREGAEKENAGIIPLGIPMLAGPGSISTVMVLMGHARGGNLRVHPVIQICEGGRNSFPSCTVGQRESWVHGPGVLGKQRDRLYAS